MDRALTGKEEKKAPYAGGTGEQRPGGKRCSEIHCDQEAEHPMCQAGRGGFETVRRPEGGFVKILN